MKIIARLSIGLATVVAAGLVGAFPASADEPDEVACISAEASAAGQEVDTGLQCLVLPL